jgi:hypothetical protein
MAKHFSWLKRSISEPDQSSTATAERSFSTLRRLKNYLRSTMGEERLNGLALANIHKDITIDPLKVAKLFAVRSPRRMEMGDWSKD